MENRTLSPTDSGLRGDLWRILIAILLIVATRAYVIANTEVTSRDSLVFARYAVHLDHPPKHPGTGESLGDAVGVIRFMSHPPGLPVLIRLFAKPFLGDEPMDWAATLLLTGQLIGAASAILFVFPAFWLLKRIFDRNVAFVATALFACMPVYVEVTSDGISDGPYLFCTAMMLWFSAIAFDRTTRRGSFAYAVAAGLMCGLGYLFRPDVLIPLVAVGLTIVVVCLRRWKSGTGASRPFVQGVGTLVGFLAVVSPYVVTIGKLTNKPTGLAIIDTLFGNKPEKTYFERDSRAPKNPAVDPAVDLPLGAWFNPALDGEQSRSVWGAKAVAMEFMKSCHYVAAFLALIGIVFLRRQLADPRLAMLLAVALIHLTILWVMARGGYVSQRHTLLSVFIACVFSAAAIAGFGRIGVRWKPTTTVWTWGTVWVVMLLAIALPRDFRGLHRDRAGHKQAGLWIRENTDPTHKIVDPFGWAEFYAGRSVMNFSHGDARWGSPILYAVVEPNAKSPHSRLDNLEPAMKLMAAGDKVYQWPVDAEPDQVRVAVYRSKPLAR
jgi:4-amino-4-deoxy-L-arabinose transferase-like glycosyltransferase